MNTLIVLSGKQYSGKDTVAKILLENFSQARRIGLGDAIKIEYAKKHNITLEEVMKNKHLYREGLIELGDWGRAVNPDYWIEAILKEKGIIIVPDMRMKHEFEIFSKHNAFKIRVNSTAENRSKRGVLVKENDPTECGLDDVKAESWDYIIENDGTYEELVEASEPLIEKIKLFLR